MTILSRWRPATKTRQVPRRPARDLDAAEKREFYERMPALPIPLDRGRIAKHWIPEGCRLLDIGCGAGYHVRHFARKAARVVAIDLDAVTLPIARRRVPSSRVMFLRYGGDRLPFADASFDAVSVLDVLEHVTDRPAMVAEIARVLRPGGVWIVSVPYRGPVRWLSPENMACDFPRLYRLLARALPAQFWVRGHNATGMRHEHFDCCEMETLAGAAFRAERAARRGSLLYGLAYLGLCFPWRRLKQFWASACFALMALDYQIPYGPAAYNLIMRFRRQIPDVRSNEEDEASGFGLGELLPPLSAADPWPLERAA